MANGLPYATAAAFRRSILDRARRGGIDGDLALRALAFSRLMARLNTSTSHTWVLKGGNAMLARVMDARSTTDFDLAAHLTNVDMAVDAIRDALWVDLNDFHRYEMPSVGSIHAQPGKEGRRVRIVAHLGPHRLTMKIDLVSGSPMTGIPDKLTAPVPVDVPGVEDVPILVYPKVDHIADKVCATAATYSNGRRSSRTHDLVDLIVWACNERVEGTLLRKAIHIEWKARQLQGHPTFDIPPTFARDYYAYASATPAVRGITSFEVARDLAQVFLDPVLTGSADGLWWDPRERRWEDPPAVSRAQGRASMDLPPGWALSARSP